MEAVAIVKPFDVIDKGLRSLKSSGVCPVPKPVIF
jgi:hypothetical protein